MTDRAFAVYLGVAFLIATLMLTLDPFDVTSELKILEKVAVAATYAVMGWLALKHNTVEARGYFVIAATYILIGVVILEPAKLMWGPSQPLAEDWA